MRERPKPSLCQDKRYREPDLSVRQIRSTVAPASSVAQVLTFIALVLAGFMLYYLAIKN